MLQKKPMSRCHALFKCLSKHNHVRQMMPDTTPNQQRYRDKCVCYFVLEILSTCRKQRQARLKNKNMAREIKKEHRGAASHSPREGRENVPRNGPPMSPTQESDRQNGPQLISSKHSPHGLQTTQQTHHKIKMIIGIDCWQRSVDEGYQLLKEPKKINIELNENIKP